MQYMKSLFYISLFTILLCLGSCTDNEEVSEAVKTRAAEFDVEFYQNTDDKTTDDSDNNTSGLNGVLDDYFIDGKSIIIISQRGTSLSIDFNDYKIDSEGNQTENENLYKYVYYSNPSAKWENLYNFQPSGNHALDWDYIGQDRLNGEYALGALYYPIGYKVYNSVEADQSIYDNLLRSNILGAWHRTNTLKTRLRFRFFHLMEAIRVTLLIPAWDSKDNSGFGTDAAKSATLLSVIKEFDIDWSLDNSSETPPNAQYTRNGVEPCDIRMFLESVDNEVKTIKLSEQTPSFPEEKENVRKATFVVLFPPQQPASNGPAMRFILKTMGGQEKSYVWNTNNMYDNTLSSEGGRVNNLILYLPRKDHNAILIKAHILDWIEAESQFTVVPDDI